MKCGRLLGVAILLCFAFSNASAESIEKYKQCETYKFVDLSPYVNHDATATFGLGYGNLPVNTLIKSKFTGTPFVVSSYGDKIMIGLQGWWPQYPSYVDINVNDFAFKLFFFGHVHAWIPSDEIHGKYVINYENGSFVEIPLDGRSYSPTWNIDDMCCTWRAENTNAAVVAWEDNTQRQWGRHALIREFAWENPYPDLKITTITFSDSGTSVSPMLFGLTYVQKTKPKN